MPRLRPAAVLPRWQWLWFPPLLLLVILPVRVVDPRGYRTWVDGELGLIELATPVLAILGALYGAVLARDLLHEGVTKLCVWVVLLTLACIYFAGEEVSWGQQLFGWQTPEAVARLNNQHETNLHNMSSWFDQKPRLLLEVWVLVGGIVMTLVGRRSSQRLSANVVSSWFWPTRDCLPTAILAIGIRLPERFKELAGLETLPFEIRWSEPQEYYFALFLLLYLAALRERVRRTRAA